MVQDIRTPAMTAMEIAHYEQRKALLIQRTGSGLRHRVSQLRGLTLPKPVNDNDRQVSAAPVPVLPSLPPLADILSVACTATQRHGSNYSSRQWSIRHGQGDVEPKRNPGKSKPWLCLRLRRAPLVDPGDCQEDQCHEKQRRCCTRKKKGGCF